MEGSFYRKDSVPPLKVAFNPYKKRADTLYTWILCGSITLALPAEIVHLVAKMIHNEAVDFTPLYVGDATYFVPDVVLSSSFPLLVTMCGEVNWIYRRGDGDSCNLYSPCHVCFMPCAHYITYSQTTTTCDVHGLQQRHCSKETVFKYLPRINCL